MFVHSHLLGLDTDVGYIIICIQNPLWPLILLAWYTSLPGYSLGKAVPVNPQDFQALLYWILNATVLAHFTYANAVSDRESYGVLGRACMSRFESFTSLSAQNSY